MTSHSNELPLGGRGGTGYAGSSTSGASCLQETYLDLSLRIWLCPLKQ